MACYAIGDVQGCYDELRALLARIEFSADRDRLWLVGDLVNRGAKSLQVLRYVRGLGDGAVVVLGNHDLHLLALAFATRRKAKSGDTLDAIFAAPDRDALLEWLIARPLAHFDPTRGDLMVHAGLIPQWDVEQALALAREVESALRDDPRAVFDGMYGDQPERWSETLTGIQRLRFAINVFTRMRVCTADGRIDSRFKGTPDEVRPPFRPWFEHATRRTADIRVIFGHWSALGYVNTGRAVGLDTGCVWGGKLSALSLDADARLESVSCAKAGPAD